MSIDSTNEILTDAVRELVVSNDLIQKRLYNATMVCYKLTHTHDDCDFPTRADRDHWRQWFARISAIPAVGDENAIQTTTSRLSDDEASLLAESLLSLQISVARAYNLRDADLLDSSPNYSTGQ